MNHFTPSSKVITHYTAQKINFSIKDFFRKCDHCIASNPDKLTFQHLNVNSIGNKSEMLSDQIRRIRRIRRIACFRKKNCFPNRNFSINGFSKP